MRLWRRFPLRTDGRRAAVFFAVAWLGLSIAWAENIKKKFATGPNPALQVRTISGTVAVKGWDRSEVEIDGERARNDAVEANITGDGEKVSVQVQPLREHLSPEEARMDLRVRLPRQGAVRIHSERGRVVVEDVEGGVIVEAISTGVDLARLKGTVTVSTVSGPVTIQSTDGNIRVDSVGGDLKFVQVNGQELHATTNTGRIEYEGDFGMGGTYVLNNYSSPIDIFTSAKASFDLTARAITGIIESALNFRPTPMATPLRRVSPNRYLQGRFNNGQSRVEVTSYSGTIRLHGPSPQPAP